MHGGSFGASTKCAKCDGALLNEFYIEGGKTYHSWCAPSTKRKERLYRARDAVLAAAWAVDASHQVDLSASNGDADKLHDALCEYEAAEIATWQDL